MLSDFDKCRIVAAVGAILIVMCSIVRTVFVKDILIVVGSILWIVGIYLISIFCRSSNIFDNALKSFIFAIVSLFVFYIISAAVGTVTVSIVTAPSVISRVYSISSVEAPFIFILLIISYVLAIFSSIYFRRFCKIVSEMFNEKLARESGNLMLAGAILLPVIVGLIAIFVSWLLMIIVMFRIRWGSGSSI